MKQGKSLQQLAAEIERQANAKRDFVAPVSSVGMVIADGPSATLDKADPLPKLVLGDGNFPKTTFGPNMGANVVPMREDKAFSMTNLAHGQLAEYLSIPKPYYDLCLREQPRLLAENVNRWLQHIAASTKGEQRMIRTLDGDVRAMLSSRYRALENEDLAQAVLPVLLEQDLEVISCEITQRKLYIKAVDKRINRDIPSGKKMGDGTHTFFDTVSPAIVISNSEVGCGALSIETAVWTRACTNLAIFGERSLRKYHTGARATLSDEVYAMLSDETKRKTDAATWSQVRDVVTKAFDVARFDASIAEIKQMSEQKIESASVVEVVEVTRKKFGFNQSEGENILKHLIEGGDLTRYGLFNAITRTAEDLQDYDRATEFERAGGKLIELPKSDWQEIAKAA